MLAVQDGRAMVHASHSHARAHAHRPVRPEQTPLRIDQPPPAVDLLHAEIAGGLQLRAGGPTAVAVPVGRARMPGQVLLFLDAALGKLALGADLARPVAMNILPELVDERKHLLARRVGQSRGLALGDNGRHGNGRLGRQRGDEKSHAGNLRGVNASASCQLRRKTAHGKQPLGQGRRLPTAQGNHQPHRVLAHWNDHLGLGRTELLVDRLGGRGSLHVLDTQRDVSRLGRQIADRHPDLAVRLEVPRTSRRANLDARPAFLPLRPHHEPTVGARLRPWFGRVPGRSRATSSSRPARSVGGASAGFEQSAAKRSAVNAKVNVAAPIARLLDTLLVNDFMSMLQPVLS